MKSQQPGSTISSVESDNMNLTVKSEAEPSASEALHPLEIQKSKEPEYPPLSRVLLTMFGLFITAFLSSLDRLIIVTAIPSITNDFNSLGDVGWYASAYMLTMAGFQLSFGRIYTFYNPKYVFMSTVVLFEIGSAVCGAAPNSTTFIVGRAIAGLGGAGIFGGMMAIFVNILPLDQRPKWTGMFGLVFGVASVTGPLLGGVFTDHVSWRWCFYINLPFGAVVLAVLAFALKIEHEAPREKLTTSQKIMRLDPFGMAAFLPAIVCLLLALEWGGVTYAWSSARIIALLCVSGVLLIIFVLIQMWRKEYATVPPRLFMERNMMASMWYTFCTGSAVLSIFYYLPIWFQAIKGVSAVKSGIMNLPLVIGLVIGAMGTGLLTKKVGYYVQWLYICAILMPIAAGLLTTFTTTTNHDEWIGYQAFFGIALGIGMQQPVLVAQTVLHRKDVPTGGSMVFFTQNLGGSIATSIANNIFVNKLASGLKDIPDLDVGQVSKIGATDLREFVPADLLPQVLEVYNFAIRNAFYVGTAFSAACILAVLGFEWRKMGTETAKQAKQLGDDVENVTRGGTAVATRPSTGVSQLKT